MTLRNGQMPYGPIEIDAKHVKGLRLRGDGSTVILQNVEPTHVHVRNPFHMVCKYVYEELKKEG